MEKPAAMSTSNPMGMNSDVFMMNAENASPIKAIQCLRDMGVGAPFLGVFTRAAFNTAGAILAKRRKPFVKRTFAF